MTEEERKIQDLQELIRLNNTEYTACIICNIPLETEKERTIGVCSECQLEAIPLLD